MKQDMPYDERNPIHNRWATAVPTTEQPSGYVAVSINWSNGLLTLSADTNKTITAWAADISPHNARALAAALNRLAAVVENGNPE